MMDLILIAFGGFLGAVARFIVSEKLNNKFASVKYLGTFAVNIFGSLLLGFLVNLHINMSINLFMGIGFLGSFTTFSTLNVESITLIQSKQTKQFFIYLFLHIQ